MNTTLPDGKNSLLRYVCLLLLSLAGMASAHAQCNPNVAISHAGSRCAGTDTLILRGTDSVVLITWYNDTTVVSAGTDTLYVPSAAGVYHAVVAAGNCADTTGNVTIFPILTPSITVTSDTGDTICLNTNVTFYAQSADGGSNPQYQWKRNNVDVSNTATYIGTLLHDGEVILCVLTSNATCAIPRRDTSAAITMTVHALPAVAISGPSVLCVNDTAILSASPANGTYAWSTGDSTSTITASGTGSYTVTVTDQNGCSAATRPYSLASSTAQQAAITRSGDSLFTQTAHYYQWTYNGTIIPGATGPAAVASHSGDYQVSTIDSNGCRSTSAIANIAVTGIGDLSAVSGMKIYPNPTPGILHLDWSDETVRTIRITDAIGNVIAADEIISSRTKQYDLSQVASGIYYVQVAQDGISRTAKVSVIK